MSGRRHVERHDVTQPLDNSYRLIPLTQGLNALVDASDFDWLSQWNWYANWKNKSKMFYAARRRDDGHGLIYMHHVIFGSKAVDHWNRDSLDNRRTNLRKCTKTQNQHNLFMAGSNTTGYKGICWDESRGKWRAEIRSSGKRIHLGRFVSKEEAALAYDAAARLLHGDFAFLNFRGGTNGIVAVTQ